jgi:hypothetical protein
VKKLKLNVDDLAVNSLEMASIEEPRGTVHGASEAWSTMCVSWDRMKYLTSTWMTA